MRSRTRAHWTSAERGVARHIRKRRPEGQRHRPLADAAHRHAAEQGRAVFRRGHVAGEALEVPVGAEALVQVKVERAILGRVSGGSTLEVSARPQPRVARAACG